MQTASSEQAGRRIGEREGRSRGGHEMLVPSAREPAAKPPSLEDESAEQYRWVRLLIVPFCIAAGFFAATVATGRAWLLGPGIVLGPILMMGIFVYLMLSSEANSESTPAASRLVSRERARRERGRRPERLQTIDAARRR